MNKITVSFILTTYNSKDNFCQTIDSILDQNYPDIEIIVKDGGSTDGTVEAIKEYKAQVGDRLIYAVTKDTGIYDAMNQGIKMCSGDLIVVFNDVLAYREVVSDVVNTFKDFGPSCIGVHSNLDYMQDEKIIRRWRMGKGHFRSGWMPGHPTLFLKRSVYEEKGLYETNLKISADYEFMIRILKDGNVKLSYIPEVLVEMFHGENSTSTGGIKNYIESFKDGHRALVENQIPFPLFTDVCRIFRFVKQFFASGLDKN